VSEWHTVTLSELCEINIGRTPPRDRPDYWGTGSPWLTIADMNRGRDQAITKETITDLAVKDCNCRFASAGTVLLSFKLSIGKVGIAEIPLYTNEAIAALPIRDPSRLQAGYLYWALRSIDLTLGLDRAAKGLTLNKDKLARIPIPVPPPSEQRRIAEVLDRAEALRAKRRAALAQLDTLTQSIFLDMFGDPSANPKGWRTAPLAEIAKRGSEGLKRGPFGGALKKEVFVNSGYKVFEQQHAISKNCDAGRYFISGPKYMSMQAFAVKPGDFIVSCSGTVGRIFRLPPTAPSGVINQALLRIRIDETQVGPTFFEALFESVGFQRSLLGGAHGSGIDNFPPMERMRSIRIVVPPLPIQHEFARCVAAIGQLNATHEASLAQLDALFASLQYRAFRAEL
jgi:type I restriction enzyme S subunit